jgi:hypothetical protein
VNEVAKILKTEFGFSRVFVAVLARARGKVQLQIQGVTEIDVDLREKKPFNRTYPVYRRGKKPNVKEKKIRNFNDPGPRGLKLHRPGNQKKKKRKSGSSE